MTLVYGYDDGYTWAHFSLLLNCIPYYTYNSKTHLQVHTHTHIRSHYLWTMRAHEKEKKNIIIISCIIILSICFRCLSFNVRTAYIDCKSNAMFVTHCWQVCANTNEEMCACEMPQTIRRNEEGTDLVLWPIFTFPFFVFDSYHYKYDRTRKKKNNAE